MPIGAVVPTVCGMPVTSEGLRSKVVVHVYGVSRGIRGPRLGWLLGHWIWILRPQRAADELWALENGSQ